MAPAILAFQWGLVPLGRMGWAVGFVFLTAAALRLARFNIQTVSDKRSSLDLPSPAAAAIPAATIFYYPQGLHTPQQALLGMAMVVVPALLMVSTIRFRSFKTIDMGARRGYQVLIGVAGFLALVVTFPHEVLILMAYSYLLSAFIGLVRSRLRPLESADARAGETSPAPAAPHDRS